MTLVITITDVFIMISIGIIIKLIVQAWDLEQSNAEADRAKKLQMNWELASKSELDLRYEQLQRFDVLNAMNNLKH